MVGMRRGITGLDDRLAASATLFKFLQSWAGQLPNDVTMHSNKMPSTMQLLRHAEFSSASEEEEALMCFYTVDVVPMWLDQDKLLVIFAPKNLKL